MEQAKLLFGRAIEAEDYQAIGMQLRECLISSTTALQRRVVVSDKTETPQQANFTDWANVITDELGSGKESKRIRQYIRTPSTKLWHLVNWPTHERNASKTASMITVAVVVAVKEAAFLVPVQRHVGRVEVQNQTLRSTSLRVDELLEQHLVQAHRVRPRRAGPTDTGWPDWPVPKCSTPPSEDPGRGATCGDR